MSRTFLPHVITDDSALGGMEIERSLRFNDDDAIDLRRTLSSSGNRKTFTWSGWVKRSSFAHQALFSSTTEVSSGNSHTYLLFNSSHRLVAQAYNYSGGTAYNLNTTRLFRDPNAWYHIVWALDTTQSTSSDRVKLYVNGEQLTSFSTETYPSQNYQGLINDSSYKMLIGNAFPSLSNNSPFDGYMTEINFVDGSALDPSHFGYTESQTGLWRPKRYEGTYGTNGFHLEFKDNSSTSALGKDTSGNENDFTTNNFSVTDGKNYDSMIDTPTNNFPTLNSLLYNPYALGNYVAPTLRDGSLNFRTNTTSNVNYAESSIHFPKSGKWYIETTVSNVNIGSGVGYAQITVNGDADASKYLWWHYASSYYEINTDSGLQTIGSISNDDIIQVAYDVDTTNVWFGKNNSWYLSGDPSSGTPMSPAATVISDNTKFLVAGRSGSGQNIMHVNFGQRPFNYTPPTGFKALCSKNLPPNVPSIIRPQKHFDTILYSGDGSASRTITGLEFKPDFVWIKERTASTVSSNRLFDSVRGVGKTLISDNTTAELDRDTELLSYNDHGFVVGDSGTVNENGSTVVAWCWKAGGAAVSNTDGTITSQVSANKKAGFSIVTYTGDGSSGKTVGHGLDSTPVISIRKKRDASSDWFVHYTFVDDTMDFLKLNSTTGDTNSSLSAFTSTTLPVDDNTNQYVSYCWHDVPGYSKFGSYKGNGSSDGQYVHLGFRPAWLLVKNISSTYDWILMDSTRSTKNVMNDYFIPNSDSAEGTNSSTIQVDFLSNGFKWRGTSSGNNYINRSGDMFIYMAFAEQTGTTSFDTFPNAR